MKKILALIVAATLGVSSVTFAANTVGSMATAPATHSVPAKTMHHKKMNKAAPVQKAQAAQKHHKKATHSKSAPTAVPAVK
jgi:hypothetical protein